MGGIVFIGSTILSYYSLKVLLEEKVKVSSVFTIDPKYSTSISDYASLETLCSSFSVPLNKIKNINDRENIEKIQKMKPDYLFVTGLSQIISEELLDIPKYGAIGSHPALLPEGRGRAPIPWAILNNQSKTGMTLFFLDKGVDSGDIICQTVIEIDQRESAFSLYKKHVSAIEQQIKSLIPDFLSRSIKGTPQNDNLATYTAKRTPEDGMISWDHTAEEIDRLIRAVSHPYPGAFTFYNDEKMIIWSAELVSGNELCGTLGQIVKISKGTGAIIATRKGLLKIKDVSFQGKDYRADVLLQREGQKLGLNFKKMVYEIWKEKQQINQMWSEDINESTGNSGSS